MSCELRAEPFNRRIDRRVDDRIQVGAGGWVVKDDVTKPAAVKTAVRLQDLIPEPSYDSVENRLPWRLELSCDGIGVDALGAPRFE